MCIHLSGKTKCHLHSLALLGTKKWLEEMTGNERSLYPCLFRAWQARTCAVNLSKIYKHNTKLFNLFFTFNFASLQNNQFPSFLF